MSAQTEEIKSRLNLIDLIQSYIRLEKAGINFRGRCPFHQEKTPSFFVSPSRQTWRCFGCNKGGDHFSFVEEIEDVEFPEALRMLGDRVGVKIVYENPAITSERNRLYAACEEAAQFFEKNIHTNQNKNRATPMMQYLLERGLYETTIKKFRIGYAPDSWDALYDYLIKKGFKDSEIEKAGLIIKKDSAASYQLKAKSYYDRYRNRIMFPIADATGKIIAFGGRIFPSQKPASEHEVHSSLKTSESTAKYINSPETPIYSKSKILFAFDKAKSTIREKDFCVLVEGYMDVIMSYQAGASNTIGVCGTALTPDQLRLISRLTDKIIFAFDMDAAGQNATKHSLDLAGELNFQRKVVVLPSGKDPADAVLENPGGYLKSLQEARPLMEYYFEEAGKRFDIKDPIGKKQAGEFFLPHVKTLLNEIERSHWIQKFSELLSVPEHSIRKELEKTNLSRGTQSETGFTPHQSRPTRRSLLEQRLLALAIDHQDILRELEKKYKEPIPFTVLSHERLYAELSTSGNILSPELKNIYEQLCFEKEILDSGNIKLEHEIATCIREIFREHYKEKIAAVHLQIQNLEKAQKYDRIKQLLADVQNIASKLNAI